MLERSVALKMITISFKTNLIKLGSGLEGLKISKSNFSYSPMKLLPYERILNFVTRTCATLKHWMRSSPLHYKRKALKIKNGCRKRGTYRKKKKNGRQELKRVKLGGLLNLLIRGLEANKSSKEKLLWWRKISRIRKISINFR